MTDITADLKRDITVEQWDKMQETRDCPCCDGGYLERVDLWLADVDGVHEKYRHMSGDCDWADPPSLLGSDRIVASHYQDGVSKGSGCLEGEFDG